MITLRPEMPLLPSGQARPVVTLAANPQWICATCPAREPGQQLERAAQ